MKRIEPARLIFNLNTQHIALAVLIAFFAAGLTPFAQPEAAGFVPVLFGDDDDDDDESQFQAASRITLSFAEDGTVISRYQSTLFTSFESVVSNDEIRAAVIDAFQIWSQHSAINVGLVPDSGVDFGVAGLSQGDPRFGDIRVGAVPMAGDVYAVAVRSNEIVSGTWSGDLLFNSNATFKDAQQFFAVALHEAGHVLGLGHSDDTTSVMHETALNSKLNATDIADIKLLYGERVELDPHEDEGDNNIPDQGESIEHEIEAPFGSVPLLVFGDIHEASDVDYFRFETDEDENGNYSGPLRFSLISDAISCLQPRFTLFFEDGDNNLIEIDSDVSTDPTGSVLIIDAVVESDVKYFLKVETAGTELTNFGSYAIVVEKDPGLFDDLIQIANRRNYSEVDEDDLQNLFLTNLQHNILDDGHTNDTIQTASELLPPINIALHSAYREQASISDQTDIDFYFFEAQDVVMSVRVFSEGDENENSGLIPVISVFDSQFQPLDGQFKVNGNGELQMEFSNLNPTDTYYVSISANDPTGPYGVGNYDLNIAFRAEPRQLDRLAPRRRMLNLRSLSAVHTLYVARSQLFHFAFESRNPAYKGKGPEPTFWLSIYNEDGELKYRSATRASEFRTARSVILIPGSYSVHVDTTFAAPTFQMRQKSVLGEYSVWGIGVSEPTGPELIDPSDDPFAPCDKTGGSDFCYPNDRFSPDEFIFVDEDEVDIPDVPGPDWLDADAWFWDNDWIG